MSVPVLAICLPWYLSSGQRRDVELVQKSYVCQLYPLKDPAPVRPPGQLDPFRVDPHDAPVLKAWEVWNQLRLVSEARPSNATVAAAEAAYANLQQQQAKFFPELARNCSKIAPVLWGEARAQDAAIYEHPAWQTWQVLARRRTTWANSSAAQAVLSSVPPVIFNTQLDIIADSMDAAGVAFDAEGLLGNATANGTSGTSSSGGPGGSSNSSDVLLPYMPGVAAYALINSTLVTMDPISNAASLNMELRLGTVNNAATGQLIDEYGRLRIPGVTLNSDVVSSAGTQSMTLQAGDHVSTSGVDVVLTTPKKGIYYFPFDEYVGTVKILTYLGNATSDLGYRFPISVLVNQMNAATGWSQQVAQIQDLRSNYVFGFVGDSALNPNSQVLVSYEITLKRNAFTQVHLNSIIKSLLIHTRTHRLPPVLPGGGYPTCRVFCVIILLGMWVLSSFACIYAVDIVFLRPRNAVLADATLFSTLLFAMPNIRNVIPSVPPIGVGIDTFGFIWIMIMMMVSGSMVFAKLVAQYVHGLPTPYDKLVRNALYEEWKEKEREKKEAEEAAAAELAAAAEAEAVAAEADTAADKGEQAIAGKGEVSSSSVGSQQRRPAVDACRTASAKASAAAGAPDDSATPAPAAAAGDSVVGAVRSPSTATAATVLEVTGGGACSLPATAAAAPGVAATTAAAAGSGAPAAAAAVRAVAGGAGEGRGRRQHTTGNQTQSPTGADDVV
ncbi:hypothetical protein HYH02_014118 [Chlamydomonas schloesseri]|uniref:Uncharacterized protein n=1 Tax=Chlamydomonas schloesseri TaxID=2026947 RepID=A0A835ST48_9CHLO|nr:hypothetical protein HYH02_014118 [Chlamydomonas schloesseri]|eukprot:KAG2429183.1 hypothetical protein HYH02_014118 [Chlamydomonas schloesseri]